MLIIVFSKQNKQPNIYLKKKQQQQQNQRTNKKQGLTIYVI